LIQHELLPLVELVPFILFFLAVFLASWLGGRGPGFCSIALSAGLADYHFMPPLHAFSVDARSLVLIMLFCLVSTIVNLLTTSAVEAYVEAQRAIQIRDDFLSIAGHELRTPLTTLRLQVEALSRLAESRPGSVPQTVVDRAHRSVDRLVVIVDQLLDVSRIRAGHLQMHFEKCNLSEIAQATVDQIRDAAAIVGSEITIDTPGPVLGRWDRARLDRVVTNLLGNAIKFGSGKPIEVRVGLDGATARVSVTDHGIGIAEADHERIFGQFEQARSAKQSAGLGLGLWITQRIVDAHGGTVSVRSKAGEGTTFTVELPLAGPPAR
jgi:two-component system OmpR family sensor kinase